MGVLDFLKRKSVGKTENAVPREWIVEGDPYWLPQTIGEWRRDEITRYKPSLGWSVSYNLTDDPVLATIYFYDGGLSSLSFGADSDEVRMELERAKKEIDLARQRGLWSKVDHLGDGQIMLGDERCAFPALRSIFILEERGTETFSQIILTSAKDLFVKVRLSHPARFPAQKCHKHVTMLMAWLGGIICSRPDQLDLDLCLEELKTMTTRSSIPVTCPACRHEQDFKVYRVINGTKSPDLKQQLLTGRLTFLTCSSCGERTPVSYPLLYHDMDKKYSIYLMPDTKDKTRDEEIIRSVREEVIGRHTCRRVRSHNELLEKINVFDDGLDDRFLEIVKLIMQGGGQSLNLDENAPIFYSGSGIGGSGKKQVHLQSFREGKQVEISLKPEAYEKLQSDFAGAIPVDEGTLGQWLEIDSHYAWNLCSPGRKSEQAKGGRYRVNATRM